MKHTSALWLVPLVVFPLLAAGCGQKVVVKVANTNVSATVNLGSKSASLNINGTSLTTGQKVSLPADFPSDVYIISGTIKTAVSTPNVSDTVSLTTTKTLTETDTLYKQHLATDGWTITTSGVIDVHSAAIVAAKGTRSVTVGISDTEGPTLVTITVMKNPNANTNS